VDYAKAVRSLKEAAHGMNAEAEYQLGYLCETGKGANSCYAVAVYFFFSFFFLFPLTG
jgi:hypothetical protein